MHSRGLKIAEASVNRRTVAWQILRVGQRKHMRSHLAQRGPVVLHDVNPAQEGLH